MKQNEIIIGFDVSKETLDVCELSDQKSSHRVIKNKRKAIEAFLEEVQKKKQPIYCCLENTGYYGLPLCLLLQEKEIPFTILDALDLKLSMGISRGKSDRADAKAIANYAKKNRAYLTPAQLPSALIMELKLLLSERSKLVKTIKLFGSVKENSGYLPKKILSKVAIQNQETIQFLKAQLKKIELQLKEAIKQDKTANNQYELMQSIPGVGPQTALEIIIATNCFNNFSDARKFACHAGIAPFEYSSGTSVRGRTKVSHLANKKVKVVLNMAALTAKKFDPQLRNYYERKVAEGKNGMLVMNSIRNKLVHRIFATIKRGTPYVKLENYAA